MSRTAQEQEDMIVSFAQKAALVHFVGELLEEDQRLMEIGTIREIVKEFVLYGLGFVNEDGLFIYTGTKP